MMLRNGASGRNDELAPKSRLEPGRYLSGKLVQPTQIPEAPMISVALRANWKANIATLQHYS